MQRLRRRRSSAEVHQRGAKPEALERPRDAPCFEYREEAASAEKHIRYAMADPTAGWPCGTSVARASMAGPAWLALEEHRAYSHRCLCGLGCLKKISSICMSLPCKMANVNARAIAAAVTR